MLLGVRQLGHRAAVGEVVGQEGGVVTEAAVAARLVRQPALAARLPDRLDPGLVDVDDRADVGDRAVVGATQLLDQQPQVLLVGRIGAGEAGRSDARAARRARRR